MITWDEYQQQALTTAIYPLSRELDYTVLGLCSEVGEIGEVYEAGKRNHHGFFTLEQVGEALSEMGDCWWYAAAIADALKRPFEDVRTYFPKVETDFIESRGLTIFRIQKHASKIAGILKKALRDNDGVLEDRHTTDILEELHHLTYQLGNLALLFNSSNQIVWSRNLNKLSDRKARGVLQGSGDHR